MKNVLFIIPFLGKTGAERVIFNLANNIDKTKFKPIILLYSKDKSRNSLLAFLEKDVLIEYLNVKGRARYNFHKILFGINKQCKKHNIDTLLISDGTANAFISPFLALLPNKVKKIARESNIPSLYEKNVLAKFLYKRFYKKYDVIISQSDDMRHDLIDKMCLPKEKVVKINNPLDINKIRKMKEEDAEIALPSGKINLVTIGRLTYQKGFDLLLTAFSKLSDRSAFHLTIVGDGEDSAKLISLTKSLGIEQCVSFYKKIENPYSLMKKADLFISSSRWEGYPNVVIESLACGTPVIANDYPGGIDEIIFNGINGYICDIEKDFEITLNSALKLPRANFEEKKINDIYKSYENIL